MWLSARLSMDASKESYEIRGLIADSGARWRTIVRVVGGVEFEEWSSTSYIER